MLPDCSNWRILAAIAIAAPQELGSESSLRGMLLCLVTTLRRLRFLDPGESADTSLRKSCAAHGRSKAIGQKMRTLIVLSTLLIFGIIGANFRGSHYSGSQLEQIMFAREADALRYRTHCRRDWHQLFQGWEELQRSVIHGDTQIGIVVWRCHEICGGLGDRQRGILTSFALAIATGRAFFIDSPLPVPLQNYFRLASSDLHWVFRDDLLHNRSVLEESFMDGFPSIGDYSHANLSYYQSFDVVIQKNNFWNPLSILQNPSVTLRRLFRSYDPSILAGCILNYLLVPASELQVQAVQLGRHYLSNSNVLAVQIRSGDNQIKNATVLDDLIAAFERCIDQVSQRSSRGHALFLTTDSVEVENRTKAIYPELLQFTGPIAHVDGFFGAASNPDKAFRKVVLDHLMLSYADQLIISRSGFAEFAALRAFRPYYLPPNCASGDQMFYQFPNELQAGVPATELNSVNDILMPSFDRRNQE